MQIHSNTILHFRNVVPENLLGELDSYFNDFQVEDKHHIKEISELDIAEITKFVQDKLQTNIFDYFLHFKGADKLIEYERPDESLLSSTWIEDKQKYEYVHAIEKHWPIVVQGGYAAAYHRANTIYENGAAKPNGHSFRFNIFIGLSNTGEHFSRVRFPIQRVELKLDRGDVIVAPGGIHHPTILTNIHGGIFKVIECAC